MSKCEPFSFRVHSRDRALCTENSISIRRCLLFRAAKRGEGAWALVRMAVGAQGTSLLPPRRCPITFKEKRQRHTGIRRGPLCTSPGL